MIKLRWVLLLSSFICLSAFADDFWQEHAIGWHWYQDPQEAQQQPATPSDPVQVMDALQRQVKYSLDQAILNPTPENIRTYIALQNQISAQSSQFAQAWQAVLLSNPQLDYSLQHPTNNGFFTDWAAAREGCSTGGDMTQTLNSATNNPSYQSMLLASGNVAWKAIQQNSFLSSDTQLAELFMSLSGTIIVQGGSNDKAGNQFKVLSSLAADDQLLKALLHGGSAKIYACDTTTSDGCLNPAIQTITVSQDSGLQTQVANLLSDMTDKILSDTALTQEEIGLLQATRLPIYKMLNVQSAFAGDKSVLDLTSYSDVIATDILFQYLDENLSVVHTSAGSLQYPDNIMAQFERSIGQARGGIRAAQQSAYSQIAIASQLIEQTQSIEQMLAGQLSAQLSNTLKWADNLRQ